MDLFWLFKVLENTDKVIDFSSKIKLLIRSFLVLIDFSLKKYFYEKMEGNSLDAEKVNHLLKLNSYMVQYSSFSAISPYEKIIPTFYSLDKKIQII